MKIQECQASRILGSIGIVGLLMGVIALICLFFPLVNLLGYEFSVVMSASLVVLLPWRVMCRERRDFGSWLLGSLGDLWVLFLPLVVILWGRHCDFVEGMGYFLLITVGSLFFIEALLFMLRGVIPGKGRLGDFFVVLLYIFIVFLSIIFSVSGIYWGIRIVFYNPFLGFVGGSIYDESLQIMWRLGVYRGLCLLLILGMLGIGLFGYGRRYAEGGAGGGRGRVFLWLVLSLLSFGGWFWGMFKAQEIGINTSRAELEEYLESVYNDPGMRFVIYYRWNEGDKDWINRVVKDVEESYVHLERFWKDRPQRTLRLYLYPNDEMKGIFFGAKRTSIAKMWLGELHMVYNPRRVWGIQVGKRYLRHEMSHLFAARYGSGPLKLIMRGYVPQMGWVEGMAVASEGELEDRLSLDDEVRGMQILGILPPLGEILSAEGFWRHSSGKVYRMVGSYVQWIVSHFGVEALKDLVVDMDYEGVLRMSFEQSVKAWEQYLSQIEVSQWDLDYLRMKYEKSSIFEKKCARSVSKRAVMAWDYFNEGRCQKGMSLMEGLRLEFEEDYQYAAAYALMQKRRGDSLGALISLGNLLSQYPLGRYERTIYEEMIADSYFLNGWESLGRFLYLRRLCYHGSLSVIDERRIAVKCEGIYDVSVRALLLDYFNGDYSSAFLMRRLERFLVQHPEKKELVRILEEELLGESK